MNPGFLCHKGPPPAYVGLASAGMPPEIARFMSHVGYRLARAGYLLRTSYTQACRETFLAGCRRAGGAAQVWAPWKNSGGFQGAVVLPSEEHLRLALQLHPDIEPLASKVKASVSHRAGMVLGADGDLSAEFVVCWTPDGCEHPDQRTRLTGATMTTIMAAHRMGVPVFNLHHADAGKRLGRFLSQVRHARLQAPGL